MAAFNKLGSLLRHSALTRGAPASSAHALFNATRLMSTKLYVSGLSGGTDDESLRQAFSTFGNVTDAWINTDRATGRSRGFGFVNFSNSDEAKEALSRMDGQELDGCSVRVSFANEGQPAGAGGYGGGGYSGGRKEEEGNRKRAVNPFVYKSSSYRNSTYCSGSPFTGMRRIKRIEVPTHYLEVSYKIQKAVVFYGPHIGPGYGGGKQGYGSEEEGPDAFKKVR